MVKPPKAWGIMIITVKPTQILEEITDILPLNNKQN